MSRVKPNEISLARRFTPDGGLTFAEEVRLEMQRDGEEAEAIERQACDEELGA